MVEINVKYYWKLIECDFSLVLSLENEEGDILVGFRMMEKV